MISRLTILRLKRWLPLVLMASLAGNVFFVGMWLAEERANGDASPHLLITEDMLATMPAADAAVLRHVLADKRRLVAEEKERRRDFRPRLRAALMNDPFDREAVERLLAEGERASADYHRKLRTLILDGAAAISVQTRRTLAAMDAQHDKNRP